jgi:hypothetical protein
MRRVMPGHPDSYRIAPAPARPRLMHGARRHIWRVRGCRLGDGRTWALGTSPAGASTWMTLVACLVPACRGRHRRAPDAAAPRHGALTAQREGALQRQTREFGRFRRHCLTLAAWLVELGAVCGVRGCDLPSGGKRQGLALQAQKI